MLVGCAVEQAEKREKKLRKLNGGTDQDEFQHWGGDFKKKAALTDPAALALQATLKSINKMGKVRERERKTRPNWRTAVLHCVFGSSVVGSTFYTRLTLLCWCVCCSMVQAGAVMDAGMAKSLDAKNFTSKKGWNR